MSKKKLIIFTSSGGGGHTAATQALTSYLESTYEIITIDIFNDVFKLVIIPKKLTLTDGYNLLLKKRFILLINICEPIYRFGFSCLFSFNTGLVKKALMAHKPDCVISVVPIVNDAILAACQEMDISFFLIPTDFDPRHYLYGIKNPTYKKFFLARVIDDPKIDSYLYGTGIPRDQVLDTGFVIRADFFIPKDPTALKKKLRIPEKVPVIMILLGSAGSDNTYTIARELHKLNTPCHVLFCIGRYTAIHDKITALPLPDHITIQVIEFTQDIADLMAVSDMFVTKPGPNSMSEALQMDVPIVIATFGRTLLWEKFNIGYVTKHGFGKVADTVNDIYRTIKELLESPSRLKIIRERIAAREKKDIHKTIQEALAHILK